MSDYPGKGDCWADFLHHRARVIRMFAQQGRSSEQIANTLSMDPVQVAGILGWVLGHPEEYEE